MSTEKSYPIDLSVVIPLYNEAESLPELHAWITRVVREMGITYEIIFIDDGSTDASWETIEALHADDEHVRAVRFARNYGKSPGLEMGFERTRGAVVITMDADLQDSPDEIPELYRLIREEDYDVVSGWKKKRYDPLSKTIPTRLFNATVRLFSGIPLHDFNSGLKSYKAEVVKHLEVYNDMHRYLPYMAKMAGYGKIGEKVIRHRPRKYGKSKFGMSRFVNGYLDLLVLWFMGTFGRKPMHFFGLWGSVMFFAGLIALVWVLADKLIALSHGVPARLVTDLPAFYLCLLAIVLGVLLFLTGFLGELIARQSPARNAYALRDEI